MKICYFGDYDSDYSRNAVIIKGLKQNNVEVLECHSNIRGRSFKKLLELYKNHKKIKGKYDLIIVGYSDSRVIVPLAKIISSKKIVWDAFYSLYDSWVMDRSLVQQRSLKAKYYWFLDWLNCKLSDRILLDTNEHIKYFINTFKINKDKFLKVLVGSLAVSQQELKAVADEENKKFKIFFYGKYIPLQGVEYIVRAAKILENEHDIEFDILGSGQESKTIEKLFEKLQIKNINFIDRVPYSELVNKMNKADICLGIFGKTSKARRVIPNKIYDAIALGKAVITSDTPAIRELFDDRKNILLCEIANENDLAKKIMELKDDNDLRELIAKEGNKIFREKARPSVVANIFLKEIRKTVF